MTNENDKTLVTSLLTIPISRQIETFQFNDVSS